MKKASTIQGYRKWAAINILYSRLSKLHCLDFFEAFIYKFLANIFLMAFYLLILDTLNISQEGKTIIFKEIKL